MPRIPKSPEKLKEKIKQLKSEVDALNQALNNPSIPPYMKRQIESVLHAKLAKLEKYLQAYREFCEPL